ncbi:MAG TPA: condensation domain-containing protein, partial [Blastocatellia bacterium]
MATNLVENGSLADRVSKLSEAKRRLLESRISGAPSGPARRMRIERRSSSSAPLSFGQMRLWFLHQISPEMTAYNIHRALRVSGPLNVAGLTQSLAEMVRRHHSFRTSFRILENEPAQIVASHWTLSVPIVDLTSLGSDEKQHKVSELAAAENARSFDLEAGPLFRTFVGKLAGNDHFLLYTLHHIISDARSSEILIEEMVQLYQAYSAGERSSLGEPELQYTDFASWQRDNLKGEVLDSQLRYWKDRLSGRTLAPTLPLDHPRPSIKSFRGKYYSITLPDELCRALKSCARTERTTLFVALLAGFCILLRRYSGAEDLSVGTVVSNRGFPEIERVIGFFVNTLVIRTDLSGEIAVSTAISRVHQVATEAFSNAELPFERLIHELRLERDLSRTPLFQTAFSFQDSGRTADSNVGELIVAPLSSEAGSAKYDLT